MYSLEPIYPLFKTDEIRAYNIVKDDLVVGEVKRRRQDWELSLGAYYQTFAMLVEVRKFLDEFKGG